MRKFIVVTDVNIFRDGELIRNFKDPIYDETIGVDKNKVRYGDYFGDFVLSADVKAYSAQGAIDLMAFNYKIPTKHLKAYELV